MTTNTRTLLEQEAQNGNLDFALEQPKSAIFKSGGGQKPRPEKAPSARIEEFRTIYNTDPHIGEAVDILVDYLVGSGYSIAPRNIPHTDAGQTAADIADLKRLIEGSDFEKVLVEWVRTAVVDGTAFIELVWDSETDSFEPRLLPTEDMSIAPDKFGDPEHYELEVSGQDNIQYRPYEVAVLKFIEYPDELWGHSFIERAQEQADMLRDMEIDMARFIATKAYPPILWRCGTEDHKWSDDQISGWLDTVENIQPDSMLAVGHDVEAEVVGVTSTSSSAGAMRLDGTFKHLQTRISTAFGLPAFLLNISADVGRNDSVTQMPKFDRRIQKLRIFIQQTVEQQVFRSILGHPNPEEYNDILPQFEFGEHSSEEERLETDEALKLFNNGFLNREAFCERVGIDPETEMPSIEELRSEIIPILQELSGMGDAVQNPNGGAPTDTGGGGESAGGEAKSRQNPERTTDTDDSRSKRDVTNE